MADGRPTSLPSLLAGNVTGTQSTNVHVGGKEEKASGTAAAGPGAESDNATMLRQLMEGMTMMRQQMVLQQQQIAELTTSHKKSTVADTLLTPLSSAVKPPVSAARKKSPAQRALYSTPSAPTRAAQRHGDAEEDEEDGATTAAAGEEQPVGVGGMSYSHVLSAVKGFVDPFYANSERDKGRTVLEFVENAETVLGNVLSDPLSPHRLMLVNMLLRDNALTWMNDKLRELAATAQRTGRNLQEAPLSWDGDLRRPFIETHMGTHSPTLWLAKLDTLKLGSYKTKTPIELEHQFDNIARHVFPASLSTGRDRDDLLLAQKYQGIIALSMPKLHENILRTHTPTTLKEWKEALVRQWSAEEQIKAVQSMQRARTTSTSSYPTRRQDAWQGRGGHTSSEGKAQAVNAVSAASTEGAGAEGEEHTVEGESSQQLSAADSSQRGGRGGRGGRGRGGAGQQAEWSKDKQRLYDEKRCFNCSKTGHQVKDCTEPRQSKEQAGQ